LLKLLFSDTTFKPKLRNSVEILGSLIISLPLEALCFCFNKVYKRVDEAWWLTPVTPAIERWRLGGSWFEANPRQKDSKAPPQ
jgi:hypothetical protein